jgi:hypothetical protein
MRLQLHADAARGKRKNRPLWSSSACLGLECNGDAYELVRPAGTRGRAAAVACACARV